VAHRSSKQVFELPLQCILYIGGFSLLVFGVGSHVRVQVPTSAPTQRRTSSQLRESSLGVRAELCVFCATSQDDASKAVARVHRLVLPSN
jgi:hypothetical protein